MFSRALLLFALLVIAAPAVAETPGGNSLEFGITLGRVDFDKAIRFENDAAVGAHLVAGLHPWWSLGIQLDRITARDRVQELWQDITVISVRTRVEPWSDRMLSAGAVLGVSFMAFQDAPDFDAISEGLDLGPSFRLSLAHGWRVRAELMLRMQTFNLIELDAFGVPTGTPEETGYLWSRVWQLGVARGF